MDKTEEKSSSRGKIYKHAFGLAKKAIIVSFFVTPIRFFLELAGFPENVIFIIGLLWLTLAFAVYWGVQLYREKRSYLILLLSLIIFSPVSRFPVFVFWWIDTRWEIGTHYGLYFDHWTQALLNQVIYGALVQIIPGFLIGSITLAVMKNRKPVTV
ncbi:hypothetical protein GWK08_16575 [Leptobacterium flavescens]|uniref:Uncharacterized protein n=1 Tax=Leptobacterium flavescens TaxID=472055 RepID=A0A6P0UNW8_9FLAO|nr:hypothetical protein [Leptobacterium flavescens]NER15071.1 hypothetical protein [Leptobacterium flavescens]